MLDNRYALLFIRGERPVMDLKYDILKHPAVRLTTDGQATPYVHGAADRANFSIELVFDPTGTLTGVMSDTVAATYELLSEEDIEKELKEKQS